MNQKTDGLATRLGVLAFIVGKLYGAGKDSGTFDYFTEATVGTSKASRNDYTASEDDNVLVQECAKTWMRWVTLVWLTTKPTRIS
jgi:hypothetical protein